MQPDSRKVLVLIGWRSRHAFSDSDVEIVSNTQLDAGLQQQGLSNCTT